ncbi:MAG: hypothetical protein ACO3LG_02285 [Ilumatobacteraceae bacterium]
MTGISSAGCGFLLAVLWFDLMFDSQTRRHRTGSLPEDTLASIVAYYRRVTTEAFPMNRLVALAMVTTVVSMTVQLVEGSSTTSLVLVALACATSAIGLAIMRTVRSAVRLGRRADDDHTASLLARTIFRDHVTSFVLMAVALVAINTA